MRSLNWGAFGLLSILSGIVLDYFILKGLIWFFGLVWIFCNIMALINLHGEKKFANSIKEVQEKKDE